MDRFSYRSTSLVGVQHFLSAHHNDKNKFCSRWETEIVILLFRVIRKSLKLSPGQFHSGAIPWYSFNYLLRQSPMHI